MEQVQREEFRITKEKIIKTHDLLVLYNERCEKLSKATQSFKALKSKNDSLSSKVNHLTEDNERLLQTIGHLKPTLDTKQNELKNLQTEYTKLEKLYQNHLLDSQQTISQLQTKSKQCSCDSELESPTTRRKSADDKIRQLKQVCNDLKSIESKLRTENRNLLKRIEVLEGKYSNAGGLKKQLETVQHKLKTAECSLQQQVDLQLNAVKKKHEEEIALLNKKISYLTSDSHRLKQIEAECDLLKQKLNKYQKCKQKDQHTQTGTEYKLNMSTQTEEEQNVAPIEARCQEIEEEECMSDIFKEMIVPWTMLSPLRCSPIIENPMPLEDIPELPNIIVTPPTPGIDATSTNKDLTVCKPAKQVLRRKPKRFWMPLAFNTLVKPRRRLVKKQQPQESDVILKALQTLQRNKITFTISNQAAVEPPKVYSSQSICWNPSCGPLKRNAMLLRGRLSDDENAEFLGFCSVDASSRSVATESVVSSASAGLQDILQQLLTGIKEISTNSGREKRRRKRAATSEFNSTTESELERLFRKSSDVLGRNRRLLAAAKEQSSNYNSLSDFDSDLMVDSGLVTATPVNDSDSILSCTSEGFKGFTTSDVTKSSVAYKALQRCQTELEKGYETPVCPVLISPLASSTKSTPPKPILGQKLELDFSIRTDDLYNCSLSDLHISQLDLSVKALETTKILSKESDSDSNQPTQPKIPKVINQPTVRKVKSKLKTPPRRSLRLSSTGTESEVQRKTTKTEKKPSKIPSRKNICDNSSCASNIVNKPKENKINIVQDILITSNSKAIDLLAGRGSLKCSLPPAVNTPVDILSQVMQDMTKTGPAQKVQPQPRVFPVAPQKLEEASGFEDCPKSPVLEEPEVAQPPKLIPEDPPTPLHPDEMATLLRKLVVFANEEHKVEEIALRLAFQDVNKVAWAIVTKLQQDVTGKSDITTPFSPPLTQTQRILIGFLLKLDKTTHPGIVKSFQRAVQRVLYDPVGTCTLPSIQPLTRVYTVLLKLKNDLDGIRLFVCECFYFSRDFAVPILFTVLTIWPNVLPKGTQLSDVPLAKLIVHLTYLKLCNQPGYNLMPLRDLFTNYYGYPTERWDCDEIFQDLLVDYIRNPAIKSAQFGVLLFLKNKPAKWVNLKVKESLLPLYQKVPDTNPHLKATLLLLYASIYRYFSRKNPEESAFIDEMSSWFTSLQCVEKNQDIKDALKVSLNRLPKVKRNHVSKLSSSINRSSNEETVNNSINQN